MTTEPQSIGELWRLIERDSDNTRERVSLTYGQIKQELNDVKKRLDGFVTRDHFEAEKRLLQQRVDHLEEAVKKLEEEASEEARSRSEEERSRQQGRRDFLYKGIIPGISLIIAAISLFAVFH
jgi:predicted nuclease with TOPRIM domain